MTTTPHHTPAPLDGHHRAWLDALDRITSDHGYAHTTLAGGPAAGVGGAR